STGAAVVLAAVLAATAAAEDVVTVRTEDGGRRDAVGEVVAYDSNLLSLRAPTGALLDFPAGDVVKVTTPRLPDHLAGLRAWAERDAAAAREKLAAALEQEPREWVRREILAALITADLAAADRASAGGRFLALYRSDPGATERLGLMPVPWGDRPPRGDDLAAANRWIHGPDDVEQLLGAGVLVGSPARRAGAVEVLQRLSRSGSSEIAELARLQRWRAKLLAGEGTRTELDAARRRIDGLPEPLRAGPLFTLGVAAEAAGRSDEAVEAFLWSPVTDSADPVRAADGLLRAGDLLRQGDPSAAIRLWREAVARFPFAEAAEDARRRLDEFRPAPAAPADGAADDRAADDRVTDDGSAAAATAVPASADSP
ncbi:tol-pal system YbgF family protein, partial [Alienimonas sp. DA493]|uniref:tetratricopeptide repeat protein n=1 Tax=Alienimonas sp. DA493 TaxID=3373605 RepID=UPI0037543477